MAEGELIYYFFRPYSPKHVGARDIEPFAPDTVLPWMEDCADHGGLPMFRARFRGDKGIFYEGTPAVYGICWGDRGNRVPTVLFFDVPEKLWLSMAASKGDWEKVIRYFRTETTLSPAYLKQVEMKVRKSRMLRYGVP